MYAKYHRIINYQRLSWSRAVKVKRVIKVLMVLMGQE